MSVEQPHATPPRPLATADFSPPVVGRAEAKKGRNRFGAPQRPDGGWDGHVFNLGHGISQHTPPEHVSALVEAVHTHSRQLRAQV